MTRRTNIRLAVLGGLTIVLAACERNAEVDAAAVDAGAYRNLTTTPTPALTPVTLPGGAQIMATPAASAVHAYLASDPATARRFTLSEVHFNGMRVREDPNGSVASLVAVLNAFPDASVRVEVGRPPAAVDRPTADTGDLAAEVAKVFVRNGLDPGRIEAAGVIAEGPVEPVTHLVVTPA